MKNAIHALAFVIALAAAPFAGAAEMVKSARAEAAPEPGKALVIFVRSSIVVGAYSAPVIDLDVKTADGKTEDRIVGILSSFSKVAYQADPGEHTFLALAAGGAPGNVAKAKVEAGKTYYIQVKPIWGFSPGFSLIPIFNGSHAEMRPDHPDLANWLKSTDFIEPTPAAQAWLQGNRDSVNGKKLAALEKWNTMSDGDKNRLTLLEPETK